MHILFKTTAKRESKQRQIISKGFYRSYIQFHFIKKVSGQRKIIYPLMGLSRQEKSVEKTGENGQ